MYRVLLTYILACSFASLMFSRLLNDSVRLLTGTSRNENGKARTGTAADVGNFRRVCLRVAKDKMLKIYIFL